MFITDRQCGASRFRLSVRIIYAEDGSVWIL
jgi:hypothetical protein